MKPNQKSDINITILETKHAPYVAALHNKGISSGFISSLGAEFVTALYRAIAEDENSFGLVAVEGVQTLGFVAFSTNLSKLYKYVIRKKGFKFAFILVPKIFSVSAIKKIWENMFYPSKMKSLNLPDAELLSIVVAPEGRGKGIAKKLILKGFEECQKRNINKVKVLVAASNEPANKLYRKSGFELKHQVDSHGVLSNIYVADAKAILSKR